MRPHTENIDCHAEPGSARRLPPEQLLIGSVLFVTALLFAPTLRFSFVYDDEGQILQNFLIRSWRFVPQYFRGQVWQYLFPGSVGNYYRPLNVLWFRLNDALFGLHPAGWHLTAVGLHLLATFLAYKIVRRVTGRPLVATLAALLFAVHPTRHEVVAWVSGTTESLWAVFFFGAFLAYLKSREGRRGIWITLSCFLYACGLLSKETAIVLPAVVFAHAWIYGVTAGEQDRTGFWKRTLNSSLLMVPYAPLAAAYVVIRIHVLQGFSHSLGNASVGSYILTLPSVLFFYLKQWLLPFQMSEFYDLPWQSHFNVQHVLLPALGLALAAGVVWVFRRKLGTREVIFAVACIAIPLAPALDLFVLPQAELVHDRYFYVPGFGAALLVSLAMEKLAVGDSLVWRMPQRWLLGTLAILVPLCYGTANASRYWIDDSVLYTHSYKIAPKNATVRNNYATQLMVDGDLSDAMPIFQELLKEDPRNYLANFNMGRLLYTLKLYPAAEHFLENARRLSPRQPDSYLDLGLIDLRTGHVAVAESYMRRAVDLRPYDSTYRFALGTVLARQGKCSQARPQFAMALQIKPDFEKARRQMQACKSDAASVPGDPGSGASEAAAKSPVVVRQSGAGRVGDPPDTARVREAGK